MEIIIKKDVEPFCTYDEKREYIFIIYWDDELREYKEIVSIQIHKSVLDLSKVDISIPHNLYTLQFVNIIYSFFPNLKSIYFIDYKSFTLNRTLSNSTKTLLFFNNLEIPKEFINDTKNKKDL